MTYPEHYYNIGRYVILNLHSKKTKGKIHSKIDDQTFKTIFKKSNYSYSKIVPKQDIEVFHEHLLDHFNYLKVVPAEKRNGIRNLSKRFDEVIYENMMFFLDEYDFKEHLQDLQHGGLKDIRLSKHFVVKKLRFLVFKSLKFPGNYENPVDRAGNFDLLLERINEMKDYISLNNYDENVII